MDRPRWPSCGDDNVDPLSVATENRGQIGRRHTPATIQERPVEVDHDGLYRRRKCVHGNLLVTPPLFGRQLVSQYIKRLLGASSQRLRECRRFQKAPCFVLIAQTPPSQECLGGVMLLDRVSSKRSIRSEGRVEGPRRGRARGGWGRREGRRRRPGHLPPLASATSIPIGRRIAAPMRRAVPCAAPRTCRLGKHSLTIEGSERRSS